jgi:hypothetical protein
MVFIDRALHDFKATPECQIEVAFVYRWVGDEKWFCVAVVSLLQYCSVDRAHSFISGLTGLLRWGRRVALWFCVAFVRQTCASLAIWPFFASVWPLSRAVSFFE